MTAEWMTDGDWTDVRVRKPSRSGLYRVICGDGHQRKARYIRKRSKGLSGWVDEHWYQISDTWQGIDAWKPFDPKNPRDM